MSENHAHGNGRRAPTLLSDEPAQQRVARGNERELDRHGDDQRGSSVYAFLCPGAIQCALPRSPVSRQGFPPVLLKASIHDKPGVANAPPRANSGVQSSFPRTGTHGAHSSPDVSRLTPRDPFVWPSK
jgi:hypothetical protein